MNLAALRNLAQAVGFPDPDVAAAVAMAESGGNPDAMGDAAFGGSVGLWQINLPSHPEYDPNRLTEPAYNAQAALAISQRGTNWSPWTTFRNGAYRQFLPAATAGNAALFAASGAALAAAWPHVVAAWRRLFRRRRSS